ncbi:MAG: alpha/beta fold hydrolase [Deltaproteobacteria bacterium]|nr:alpha/beta fold hydrolase [Deltaproteobacteria bacterium]
MRCLAPRRSGGRASWRLAGALLALSALGAGCAASGADGLSDAAADADTATGDALADAGGEVAEALPDAATDADAVPGDAAPDAGDTDSGPISLQWPVDAPGPYHVGVRTWEITYQPEAWGEPRTLLLHVWYPTEDTEGEAAVYSQLFPDPDALVDATLARPEPERKLPVLAHSHGYDGFAGNSAFLMRYFASHGWIALAPDHTGNTIIGGLDPVPPGFDYLRSLDISASLDALESLEAPDPLAGAADTSRVVLSGHSYGGYTAWATAGVTYNMPRERLDCPDCTEAQLAVFAEGLGDPRVQAIIPMAGAIEPTQIADDGTITVTIPVLAMSGSLDSPERYQAQFDATKALDLRWLELEGGCHNTFGLPTCKTLPPDKGYAIIDTYALAFARHTILADPSETTRNILDGTTQVAPEATLRRHGGP